MNCKDFRELIDSYLSDELLTETNHDVLRHLEDCADCRNLIETRRKIRRQLKSAVGNSAAYQISENFSHRLKTNLQYNFLEEPQMQTGVSWFNLKSFAAVSAGLIIVFITGFFFLRNMSPADRSPETSDFYTVAALPADHPVNIAAGDHEFCAIRHKLKEAPIALEKASVQYEDLDKTVLKSLRTVLGGCKLVMAHSCKYKGTRFAHVVLQNDNEIISVLLTDLKDSDKLNNAKIVNYRTEKYKISRFDVKQKAAYVVSRLDQPTNIKIAETLYTPLQDQLIRKNVVQSALLLAQ